MKMRKISSLSIFPLVLILYFLCSCREVSVPKPKGYFRIDLPGKNYIPLEESDLLSHLPLAFEYPSYGKISLGAYKNTESGFFNIEFPAFKAVIYLTYKDIKGDLAPLIEQTYTMNVKNHVIKADAIDEQIINNKDSKVYGILYDLKGNTATAVQFYVTDSIKHYLRGSLYFESEPNGDSLAPVIDFFRDDIIHLIETLEWEKK